MQNIKIIFFYFLKDAKSCKILFLALPFSFIYFFIFILKQKHDFFLETWPYAI
jgi:hypothetical protein